MEIAKLFNKIKKPSKKEIPYGKDKHFNITFLGLTLLTLAVVQIISASYSNSNFAASLILIGFNIFMMVSVLLVVILIIFSLELHKHLKILIAVAVLLIEFSIIANMYFAAPKAYITYEFQCPLDLNNNSKIVLRYNNLGNIFTNFQFYTQSENKNVFFVYDKNEISKPQQYFLPSKNKWENTSITVKFKENLYGSLEVKNSFDCGLLNCHITYLPRTDNECNYYCENGNCAKTK